MTITIDLMNVLYFVITYLVVGYFVMLIVAAYEIYHNLSHKPWKYKHGLMLNALWRAILLSWVFPYLIFDIVQSRVAKMHKNRIRNSVI